MIVWKLTDAQMKNEIGHIFRQYNIIEYKSPDDKLTIDDFYKTVGYACLYKGLGRTVDAVMQASVAANRESYERIRMCDPFMCEALRELMRDEIEEREREAARQADQKARQEKSLKLIRNLMETMKMTAEQAMDALKVPANDKKKYMAGLQYNLI